MSSTIEVVSSVIIILAVGVVVLNLRRAIEWMVDWVDEHFPRRGGGKR